MAVLKKKNNYVSSFVKSSKLKFPMHAYPQHGEEKRKITLIEKNFVKSMQLLSSLFSHSVEKYVCTTCKTRSHSKIYVKSTL